MPRTVVEVIDPTAAEPSHYVVAWVRTPAGAASADDDDDEGSQ